MKNALRDLPAWGISLIVNLTILFALSLIVAQVEKAARKIVIESSLQEELQEPDYTMDANVLDQIGTMGDSNSLSPTAQVAATAGEMNDVPIERKIETTLAPTVMPMVEIPATERLQSELTERFNAKGSTSEKVSGGVEGVMDRLTNELRLSLQEGPTLALWLFDASGSLTERRAAISQRFDTVYKQLGKLNATEGIHTVVASFGESTALITPQPIDGIDVSKATAAVAKIQEDKSGKENVFSALRLCIDKFKLVRFGENRVNRLVFIVTDERGDDFQQIEEVINLCKQYRFRVFVIGNGSVFGQEKGFVLWKDPSDGAEIEIPVDQGPETAFQQVLQLPFVGSPEHWRSSKRMSAGFGPYTLTRLCAETGGRYLMTDEARGDRFDAAVMRNYAPDYRPIRVIDAEIRKNPAMSALVQASSMTYKREGGLPPLTLEFRGYDDNTLRSDLTDSQKPVAEINYDLGQLYNILRTGENSRNSLKDPRWRASFDLAMGRVLAMRVRMEGYMRMTGQMKISPKTFAEPKSNMWRLVPAKDIETGPEVRKASDQAREYLKRVIDENPGTPWALVAERELSTELGWTWKEEHRSAPGADGKELTREEEIRLLLADEEEKENNRKAQASKPRTLPKL